jgi:uncharacterized cupredoxin-like copper-binding protein
MTLKILVTAVVASPLLASPVLADPGHTHFSAGVPGNPKRPARVVEVTMKEGDGTMTYEPSRVEVKRGEQIRFVLKNVGELAHEFVLASTSDNLKHAALMQKYPDMEHDDPNGKTLQPKGNAEILWRFTKSGQFEYGCLIPGHREAGMTGTIIVTEQKRKRR